MVLESVARPFRGVLRGSQLSLTSLSVVAWGGEFLHAASCRLTTGEATRVCVVDTGVDAEGKARGRQRAGDWGAPVEGELKLRGGEGKWWSLVDGDETR